MRTALQRAFPPATARLVALVVVTMLGLGAVAAIAPLASARGGVHAYDGALDNAPTQSFGDLASARAEHRSATRSAPSAGSFSALAGLGVATEAGSEAAASYPATAAEMDEMTGVEGTRVPDTANTPGRGKVTWELPDGTKITYEQHPYHEEAPEWHRDPHWHIDEPGEAPHQRRLPGDPYP